MMGNNNDIQRYTEWDRRHHGLIAISFLLAAASGLALFYPAFFSLSYLLGGPTWARILHPFIGVALFGLFFWAANYLYQHNRLTDADRQWLKRLSDVLRNRSEGLPEVGKYNAGQKVLFWSQVYGIAIVFVTGVIMWQPWFTPFFPVNLVRVAVLLHALAAFVLIAGLIVHVYAAIWVKGTLRAMTRGTVTQAWAKTHHPGWYRSVSKGTK
jgi:formate dehydrogenase subunit gamma